MQSLVDAMHSRLAAVEGKLGLPSPAAAPVVAASSGGGAAASSGGADLSAFDALGAKELATFVASSKALGAKGESFAAAVQEAFDATRAVLVMAAETKKPADAAYASNVGAAMKKISGLVGRDEFEKHGKALAEAAAAFGWVAHPTPAPCVREAADAAKFWSDKVIVEHKSAEAGAPHVQWSKDLIAFLNAYHAYVKENHAMGLSWNPKGKDAAGAPAAAASAAPAAAASSAPAAASTAVAAAGAAASVFAQLSQIDQSGGKTQGLKHVTKDMKSSANKDAPPVVVKAPVKKAEVVAPKVQIFALQGNKWVVEGQTGAVTIAADQVSVKNTVYVYNCIGATITIEGKCNTITCDGCKNTTIVFRDVLALCEVVNGRGIKITCLGKTPTVAIDKTDGIIVKLSRDTYLETKIVASKSSEMNVSFPGKTDDDDWLEKVIPEQYVHKVTDKDTVTADVSELYSHGG